MTGAPITALVIACAAVLSASIEASTLKTSSDFLGHSTPRNDVGEREIPDGLLFNDKVDLLDQFSLQGDSSVQAFMDFFIQRELAKNVKHTIGFYPAGYRVQFLNNQGCAAAIEAAHSKELANRVTSEPIGMYKSDICRLAQLKLHGGYYSDSDLHVLRDMRDVVPPQASFASVISLQKDGMFQAFLAAVPNHPIISKALDLSLSYYQRDNSTLNDILDRATNIRGTVVLRLAYEDWMMQPMGPGLQEKHDADWNSQTDADWMMRLRKKEKLDADWMMQSKQPGLEEKLLQPSFTTAYLMEEGVLSDDEFGQFSVNEPGLKKQVGTGDNCEVVVMDRANRKVLAFSHAVGSQSCQPLQPTMQGLADVVVVSPGSL